MRIVLAIVLAAFALAASAQSTERARPPGTAPLAEPPPLTEKVAPEPQVSERVEGEQVIQEYRVNGKLYMQKVTPKHGKSYILMDHVGDGTFTKFDEPLDSRVRVPQWVLLEF